MGTFASYFGSLHVPEEQRSEFATRMRELFTQGGMMTLEPIKIMGIAVEVMTPPLFKSDNRRFFVDYNYFEDDWWEGTGFNAEDDPAENTIWSQKIGERQFNWVTTAAYVLSEFYSDSFMVTEMDGQVINAVEYIGWLNYLFNETYTNARIKNLWNIYKLLPDFARHRKLERLLRDEDLKSLSYMGFLTYMVIAHPEEFQPDDTALDAATTMSLADAILSWLDDEIAGIKWSKAFLQNLKETSEDPAAELVRLKELMTLPTMQDIVFPNENERRFAIYTKFFPYEIVLFLLAEAFEVDFWSLLEELEPHIPKARHDWYERSTTPFSVITPVKTSQFLECNDDDRAYWWTPGGDVTFSGEMEQWMSGLNEEMKEILATEGTLIAPGDFFMTFLKTLEDANASYRRVYAFSSMFQEFIGNGARREFQAAVILLQRLLKRYEAEIQTLQNERWPSEWNLPGRKNIKRYLAILANTELRQHVLGF